MEITTILLTFLLVGAYQINGEYIAAIGRELNVITTATVIHRKFLVTAAHFIKDVPPGDLWARAGSNRQTEDGELVDVDGYVLHPLFDPYKQRLDKDTNNNMALVILVRELTHPNIVPIPLSTNINHQYDGKQATTSSWGFDRSKNDPYKNTQIDIKNTEDCKLTHSGVNCSINFWAYTPNCDIERGSPVVINNELIGIVSDPRWCAGKGDLFVNNLSYYRNWLLQVMNDNIRFHY